MQHSGNDDPLLRPVQRRETIPVRMTGQPTNSFGVTTLPVIHGGARMPAYYASCYSGGSPQKTPMYYQPHPAQFVRVGSQLGMSEPSLMGFLAVPINARRTIVLIYNNHTRTSQSRPRRRRTSLEQTSRPLISKPTILNARLKLRRFCVKLQTFNEIFTQSGRQDQAKIAVHPPSHMARLSAQGRIKEWLVPR